MRLFALAVLIVATSGGLRPPLAQAQDENVKTAMKLLEEAGTAFQSGKAKEAIELATKAAKLDPKNPAAPFVIGSAHLSLRQNEDAAKAFTTLIELDPKYALAYDRRGDAYLKSGKFKEAVADFDKFLELRPKFAPDHWRRGIALYYAGKFDEGRKQFDLHRTVNPEDVENSAWHYLCNARANTPKKSARRPHPGHEGRARADEAGARTIRREVEAAGRARRGRECEAQGRGAEGSALLREPVRRALLRERGRREEGARTPHGRGREVQDRPLHVGRGRRAPSAVEETKK